MAQDGFQERIIRKYNNKLLSPEEIRSICEEAIDEGLITKDEIQKISNCLTVELLNNIKKWKSAFLYSELKLNSSSESEYETIKEDWKTPDKSCFFTPNRNESYISHLYNSPNNAKLICGKELENPFSPSFKGPVNSSKENDLQFESFCEDLKEKTKSIKKTADDRKASEVKALIDEFIRYTEGRRLKRTGSYKIYLIILIMALVLLLVYTPQPI